MKAMARVGAILFGLIFMGGIYRFIMELINEAHGIYKYTDGYLRDLILTELIIGYALIFSLVVLINSRKK